MRGKNEVLFTPRDMLDSRTRKQEAGGASHWHGRGSGSHVHCPRVAVAAVTVAVARLPWRQRPADEVGAAVASSADWLCG